MITVVQRVSRAEVRVGGEVVGSIGVGLVGLVGVVEGDGNHDVEFTARKLTELRVMQDDHGRMNHSVVERGGELLLVSQFTLAADIRRGRRPSFSSAAPLEVALAAFERLVEIVREYPVRVATGVFAATMEVDLVNDGPVTLILNSRNQERAPRGDSHGSR